MAKTPINDEPGDDWLTVDAKMSRWRAALVITFVASLIFLGGVQTQKWLGASSSASATPGLPSGLPAGFATGGLPAGLGGGSGVGAPSSGNSTGSGDSTASAPTVIGSVVAVNGDVWTIKDIGGTSHKLTVTGTVPIHRETAITAADVAVGQSVTVYGTKDSTGAVTASAITVR